MGSWLVATKYAFRRCIHLGCLCTAKYIYIPGTSWVQRSILANDTVGSSNILTGGSTILFLKIPYETTFETAENPLHYDVEDTLHVVTHYKGAT